MKKNLNSLMICTCLFFLLSCNEKDVVSPVEANTSFSKPPVVEAPTAAKISLKNCSLQFGTDGNLIKGAIKNNSEDTLYYTSSRFFLGEGFQFNPESFQFYFSGETLASTASYWLGVLDLIPNKIKNTPIPPGEKRNFSLVCNATGPVGNTEVRAEIIIGKKGPTGGSFTNVSVGGDTTYVLTTFN